MAGTRPEPNPEVSAFWWGALTGFGIGVVVGAFATLFRT